MKDTQKNCWKSQRSPPVESCVIASSDFSTAALMMNALGHTGAVLSRRLQTASADAVSIKAKVDLT